MVLQAVSGGRCSSTRLFRELEQQRRLRKRHLKKCVHAASNFIALIFSFQMLVNFSGVEFQRTVSKFGERKKDRCLVFFSTKREVRQFHVVVLQRRLLLLFCLLNVLLFSRSCCRRPCLSPLIFLSPLYYHPYVNEVLKMTFLLS